MDFGNLENSTLDVCHDCGCAFEHINEEAIELRCINCQTKWRIANAANPHCRNSWNDWRSRTSLHILMRMGMVNVEMQKGNK